MCVRERERGGADLLAPGRAELVQIHAEQPVDELGVGPLPDGAQFAQVHTD